jgi:cell pole-organizing protein PopZ
MSQTAKVQEPSMEEILASIRRIIAEDDGAKAAHAPEPAAAKQQAPLRAPVAPLPPRAAPSSPAASQNKIDAILAELDAPLKAASNPAPGRAAAPSSVADMFNPAEAMAPAPPTPSFRTIDPASDVVFTDRLPDPPAESARIADEAARHYSASPGLDRALISATTVAAMDGAFNSLAQTVIGQNARTLEDLVKEMLRPLLKSWLDDNLPGLVERIVRAEIERVSRGRR